MVGATQPSVAQIGQRVSYVHGAGTSIIRLVSSLPHAIRIWSRASAAKEGLGIRRRNRGHELLLIVQFDFDAR